LNTPKVDLDLANIKEPLYDIEELNYIVSPDHKKTFDSRQVLARILDGSEFQEYKK
jgi:3-methylcrotonyl-CoA carboxylase beta subunit